MKAATIVSCCVLAACGGGGGNGGPTGVSGNPPSGNVPTAAQVSMVGQTYDDGYGNSGTNYSFNPASVTIARGGTVTWTNANEVVHNVTFSTPNAPANIADHSTGTNTRTFSTAGTFSYRCTNHNGMAGTVIVQ